MPRAAEIATCPQNLFPRGNTFQFRGLREQLARAGVRFGKLAVPMRRLVDVCAKMLPAQVNKASVGVDVSRIVDAIGAITTSDRE